MEEYNYYPEYLTNIDLNNVPSPWDILLEAKGKWKSGGEGLLKLDLEEQVSYGTDLAKVAKIDVYASFRAKGSVHLFSVCHGIEKRYPVSITVFEGITRREIFCDCPEGFRQALAKVFNDSCTKRRIFGLVSGESS